MFATTGNDVEGYVITEYLGVVRGIVVRAPNIAQGFIGGLINCSSYLSVHHVKKLLI